MISKPLLDILRDERDKALNNIGFQDFRIQEAQCKIEDAINRKEKARIIVESIDKLLKEAEE